MATINVNTDILQKYGEDILKLSNDYDLLVKDFFARISKIDSNGIWVGSDNLNSGSKAFIQRAMIEHAHYLEFGHALNQCGESMIQYAKEVDAVAKGNQIG